MESLFQEKTVRDERFNANKKRRYCHNKNLLVKCHIFLRALGWSTKNRFVIKIKGTATTIVTGDVTIIIT